MDTKDVDTPDHHPDTGTSLFGVAAINSQYAAWLRGGHCHVQKLAAENETFQRLTSHVQSTDSRPVLALSRILPSVLAIASGSQIQIWDLAILARKCTLPGIGRSITALAWSPLDRNVLATGSIDGSICIWDLRVPERPIRHLRASRELCESISFSTADKYYVACVQRVRVSIWDLRRQSVHPAQTTRLQDSNVTAITWQLGLPCRLLVATDDRRIELFEVSGRRADRGSESSSSSGDEEQGHNATQSSTANDLTPIWVAAMDSPARYLDFVTSHTICALAGHGCKAFLCETNQDNTGISDIYSHDFENKVDALYVKIQSGTGIIASVESDGAHTIDLPIAVLDKVSSRAMDVHTEVSEASASNVESITPEETEERKDVKSSGRNMRPISILSQRRISPGFSRTSNQLQLQRRSRGGTSPSRDAKPRRSTTTGSNEASTPPAIRSITSSLELPKSNETNGSSSMPFLSPSIPSRQSPNGLPSLEDSTLSLPPLAAPILESSLTPKISSATDAHDSDDSDDDTFVEALEGSTTFLPGGINVPLPKACGALFAPNGQLLTFFPPKPRPGSAHAGAAIADDQPDARREKANRVSRLFPSFGKFGTEASQLENGWDSSSSESSDSVTASEDRWPQFTMPQASFPSQQSWRSKLSPAKASYSAQPAEAKIVVSVYEVDDVSILCTSQCSLAERYQILPHDSETKADVCEHNSAAAEAIGLEDTAYIWNLVAMLLSDKVPLELLPDLQAERDVLVVARNVKRLNRSDSGVDLSEDADKCYAHGQLRWADDPLGAPWLIRRLLEWAERRSDIQLLACICAVLKDKQGNGAEHSSRLVPRQCTSAVSLEDYVPSLVPQRRRSSNRGIPPIPVLRTNSLANSSSVYESPIKTYRSSNTSSRNASQPTTPYLESTSSTPPFSLSLTRQATHLSTSGSTSPEFQRSSFRAAAKYYAQSITDKFASYGTSPPTKRTGTSPGTSNELSSSLPPGSWSKSVSFAMSSSTNDTTRGSLLSRSYDDPANDHMYDSDRTVDDSSSAHHPKEPSSAVYVAEKNQGMFSDDISGATKTSLIPEDLANKAVMWCQYYAEQLRSWDLHSQAAELEKIAGIKNASQSSPGVDVVDAEHESRGHNSRDQSVDKSCSVCLTSVRLMELVCPSCNHVSHISCLEDYIAADETDFECPTNCGCQCSEVVYALQEIRNTSPQTRPNFRKKMSFTDPRSWRARIEGDNNW